MSQDGVSRRAYLQAAAVVGGGAAAVVQPSETAIDDALSGGGGDGGMLAAGGGTSDILRIEADEEYRIDSNSEEEYTQAILDGVLVLDGTLRLNA